MCPHDIMRPNPNSPAAQETLQRSLLLHYVLTVLHRRQRFRAQSHLFEETYRNRVSGDRISGRVQTSHLINKHRSHIINLISIYHIYHTLSLHPTSTNTNTDTDTDNASPRPRGGHDTLGRSLGLQRNEHAGPRGSHGRRRPRSAYTPPAVGVLVRIHAVWNCWRRCGCAAHRDIARRQRAPRQP